MFALKLNSFKPSGIYHSSRLDQFICVLSFFLLLFKEFDPVFCE